MARRKNAKAMEVVKLIDCVPGEVQVRVWQTINKLRESFGADPEVLGWATRYIEAVRQDAAPSKPRRPVYRGVVERAEDVTN